MNAAVVDVSVVLTWCFLDEAREDCDRPHDRLVEEGALIPEHWWLEVANSLLAAERRARIQRPEAQASLVCLGPMHIDADVHTRENAWTSTFELSRAHRLTVYDAAYLELAIRSRRPLATLDRELRAVVQATGVPLLI